MEDETYKSEGREGCISRGLLVMLVEEIIRSKLVHKRKETRESRLKKHIIIHIETHCAAEREVP